MSRHLHIVSFDVPYPADYGGVVDVFYKIKALYEIGVKVHLHCFEYGRGKQPELEKYCVEVIYYSRQVGQKGFSMQTPYIVSSRNDELLWKNLEADSYPILFEGTHCTYGVYSGAVSKKNIAIRLHNIEYEYYKQLSKWETSLVRKAYMLHESRLLKRYEVTLKDFCLLSISNTDCQTYRTKFKSTNIQHLPAFVSTNQVISKVGKGDFVLYHGNLSVAENEKTAIWLLEKVFSNLDIRFIIAGKNPSKRLIEKAKKYTLACIITNPSEEELNTLLEEAQVHILPSMIESGIKLKLLNALFKGRHIVANSSMLKGTNLDSICQLANNPTEIKYHVYRLFHKEFTHEDILLRKALLNSYFNNRKNAELIMNALL